MSNMQQSDERTCSNKMWSSVLPPLLGRVHAKVTFWLFSLHFSIVSHRTYMPPCKLKMLEKVTSLS